MYTDICRCRRGERCGDRDRLRDPVTGEHLGWDGAQLTGADTPLAAMRSADGVTRDRDPVPGSLTGLCPGCIATVDQALVRIPGDIAEITTLLPARLSGSSMESGTITRPDPGPATPMRDHLYALRELLDHEACAWAAAAAQRIRLEWSRDVERHSRIGARVEAATQLLRYRLGVFLSLPATRYRARSLTSRRADEHDLEMCVVQGDDIWDTSRDGVDGAVVLERLHRLAWRAGSHSQAPDRLHMPCRNRACHRATLVHWPGEPDVVCMTCAAVFQWDDYDELRSRFLAA